MKILYGLLMLVCIGRVQSDTTRTVIDERVEALEQEHILLKDLRKKFASQQQEIVDLIIIRTAASQQRDIEDLKKTLVSQQQTIAELKGEVASQQQNIEELKRKVLSQQQDIKLLKDLPTEQQQDVTEDEAKARQEEKQTLNTLLNTSKKRFVLNTIETVAFEATIASAKYVEHSHLHDRILFDSVSLNAGNGYHSGNGTFVATVGGIYIFSTSVMMHGTNTQDLNMHVILEKNGVEIAGAFAYNHGSFEHSSVTAAMALQPGDSVFVSVERHDDITFFGDRLTSFMGFLLSPF